MANILALDCEMIEDFNGKSMVGQVSIVNGRLETVYDTFVIPPRPIRDYRTQYSGITMAHLQNQGIPFSVVKQKVENYLKNADIIVGHSIHFDYDALEVSDNVRRRCTVDISKEPKFLSIGGGIQKLKDLALTYLGQSIQTKEHNSLEDAKAIMMLYLRYCK